MTNAIVPFKQTHISAIERDLDSPLREANSIDSDDSIIEILTRELQVLILSIANNFDLY